MAQLVGEAAKLTFNELLAKEANKDRLNLVFATLEAFKDGDQGAQKIVMQALQESLFTEESKFPISDTRFEEIIMLAAERIQIKNTSYSTLMQQKEALTTPKTDETTPLSF